MAYDFLFNTQNTTQCLLETYIDFWLVDIQSKSCKTHLQQILWSEYTYLRVKKKV